MIKPIPISQVTLGMYIVDIPGHDLLGIRQQGLIRNPQILRVMQQRGVESVMVDFDRSSVSLHPKTEEKAKVKRQIKPAPIKQELPRAQKLYDEARQLQQRTMESLYQGDTIDLEEVDDTADKFIDSVFRNDSALSCLRLIKDKDDYLLEHSIGVAILMVMFGRHLGLSGEELHHLCVGSLLHDIGKIKIPEKILNKPGKLTDAEFTIMKSHAMHSREIIKATPGINKISLDVAAQHHEKLDGSGYPSGLRGDQISRYGRMITICDIYDAMTADRVYRRGLTGPQALKRLLDMAPHQLDNELLHQFINCIGVYPPGSFVELSNGVIAIVLESKANPLLPLVKVIYNTHIGTHIMVEELDLSSSSNSEKIVRAVKPEEFRLNPKNYV
ncbi:HD-GYP domain-containing protein [uncultured Ferrimonas sp.]|uniref:HD-GYP domain-containing protein n=1 Tax=uncultured Ferrimonas sp. TaxID=432640 RepID=UPI00263797EE|nr:HD-GYP domain-containing protein [uncultured Ferrimonas sp.]